MSSVTIYTAGLEGPLNLTSVGPRMIFAGPNGSGKTTALRCIELGLRGAVADLGPNAGALARLVCPAGELNLHGVAKPVTATLTFVGSGKGMAGETRAGFEGTLEIKRSDFGMNQLLPAVGDEVRLIVSLEGVQK